MSQESQAVWPGAFTADAGRDDKALDAVFESLGHTCVHRLVSVPQPFGLAPRDRRAAQRWLSRRALAQRQRDLTIVLALVASGLAAAFIVLSFYRIP